MLKQNPQVEPQEEESSLKDNPALEPPNLMLDSGERIDRIQTILDDIMAQARENAKQSFLIEQVMCSLEELAMTVRATASDATALENLEASSRDSISQGEQSLTRIVESFGSLLAKQEVVHKLNRFIS